VGPAGVGTSALDGVEGSDRTVGEGEGQTPSRRGSDDDPGGGTPTRVYRLPQGASRGQSLAQRRGRQVPALDGARFRRGQPARRVVVEQILLDTPKPLPHFGLGQVCIL
jgi:hypothetical protein